MADEFISKADFYKFVMEFNLFKAHVESEIGNSATEGNINRNLNKVHKEMEKVNEAYFGNGKPGMKAELLLIKETVTKSESNRTWLNRLFVGAIIVQLIGVGFMMIKAA